MALSYVHYLHGCDECILFFRYISRMDAFFSTRSVHSLLDVISLESLRVISDHLSKIQSQKRRLSSLNSIDSPLVHLSVHMDPSACGIIQLLQSASIPGSSMKKGNVQSPFKFDASKHSLASFYASGIQCDVLICRNLSRVPSSQDDILTENNQTTLKLSSNLFLPVFQAGLFTFLNHDQQASSHTEQSKTKIFTSLLNFHLENPSSIPDTFIPVNILEACLHKSFASVTAKIIQSEFSSDPVLTWDHIHAHDVNQSVTQRQVLSDVIDRSELSSNSIALNMKVSSRQLVD